ncbi:ImmA/IrrE family metallo-endopeptidase [Fusobacterium varium]|nr:ImmA/IrrE family metallo-endopeptidase [Fusobacterium varium]
MRKKEISKLAKKLTEEYETNDPKLLSKYLGILIIYEDIGDIKGTFIKSFDDKYIIINNRLKGFTKSFVTGHELFHALEDNTEQIMFLNEHTLFSTDEVEEELMKYINSYLNLKKFFHRVFHFLTHLFALQFSLFELIYLLHLMLSPLLHHFVFEFLIHKLSIYFPK